MKVIKIFVTQSVIAPPPKRNLIPRFTKGGGAHETMIDALIVEKRGYQNSREEEDFSTSHAASSFCAW
jgi:hypothetical protein